MLCSSQRELRIISLRVKEWQSPDGEVSQQVSFGNTEELVVKITGVIQDGVKYYFYLLLVQPGTFGYILIN
eukprot:scaffold104789_cov20-Cyclotella_meneghiniana.AAC.1